MKTSIYIPLTKNFSGNLNEIISLYNKGSLKPDEIIINAFGVDNQESLDILHDVQSKKHDNVKIYARKVDGNISEILNYSLTLTTGNIILYHDSKKLPSIKRVEIVEDYFDTFDILSLAHTWFGYDVVDVVDIDVDKIKMVPSKSMYKRYFPFDKLEDAWVYTRTYGQEFGVRNIDMGSLCVRRELLEDMRWHNLHEIELHHGSNNSSALYYDFCLESLYKYNKSSIIDVPLTFMR